MYNFIAVSSIFLSIPLIFTPLYFDWYLKFNPCLDCLIMRFVLCLILALSMYSLVIRFKPIIILLNLILASVSIIAAALSGNIITILPQVCKDGFNCIPALQPYFLGENLTGWGLIITLLTLILNGVFVTIFAGKLKKRNLNKFNLIQKISIVAITITLVLNAIDITYNLFIIF